MFVRANAGSENDSSPEATLELSSRLWLFTAYQLLAEREGLFQRDAFIDASLSHRSLDRSEAILAAQPRIAGSEIHTVCDSGRRCGRPPASGDPANPRTKYRPNLSCSPKQPNVLISRTLPWGDRHESTDARDRS